MFEQIFIGSILITATIVVEVIFIQIAITGLKRYGDRFFKSARVIDQVAILTAVTLWMLTALSLSIWVWAFAFWELGAFTTLEEALYFSMVSFTTLGFGDVTLPQNWRLLSGIIAANGLIVFGLSTALLIEILHRIYFRGPRR